MYSFYNDLINILRLPCQEGPIRFSKLCQTSLKPEIRINAVAITKKWRNRALILKILSKTYRQSMTLESTNNTLTDTNLRL
jgi:hypothetical protein